MRIFKAALLAALIPLALHADYYGKGLRIHAHTSNVDGGILKSSIFYDLRDYGAVCNGSTDDTVAIQAALTAAAGKGVVVLGKGGTCITQKLNVPSSTTIYGYGLTLKLKNNTNDTVIQSSGTANVKIFGITIDGNKANQTIFGPLIGMYFIDAKNIEVKDTVAHDVYGIGYGNNCVQRAFFTQNISYSNADNGFDFNGDFYSVPRFNQGNLWVNLQGNQSYSNGADGFFFGHGRNESNIIHGNNAYANTGNGFQFGEASTYIGSSSTWKNNIVDENISTSNGNSGVVAWWPKWSTFKGNQSFDNGTYGMRFSVIVSTGPGPTQLNISENHVGNISGSMPYGIILEGNNEDFNYVHDNILSSILTTAISKVGVNTKLNDYTVNSTFTE